ncbi:hypothetical protein [Streptomyces sp. NPDC012888]|uniref:hypothetical protein n=1 Tax=Streptomyces sp. NPDC012888 TaxID=3364855 RepID=UPI00367B32DC
MAAHGNSQGPEGDYDPAGSTQMFRAFVEEADAGPAGAPAARGRRRQSGSGVPLGRLGLALGVALLVGAVAWLALR